jgi:hypothetical protein
MKKPLCAAALLIGLAVTQAHAKCEDADLRGRWDVYGIGDFFEFGSTFDCVFLVKKSGRFARSICINRAGFDELRSVHRGELAIRRNCLVEGDINVTGGTACIFDGTMTRSKDAISGVANCDTGLVEMFNMVRR